MDASKVTVKNRVVPLKRIEVISSVFKGLIAHI